MKSDFSSEVVIGAIKLKRKTKSSSSGRSSILHKQYSEFMANYLNSGHSVSQVSAKDHHLSRYYLPHHCVVKPETTTTKLRVVFDFHIG